MKTTARSVFQKGFTLIELLVVIAILGVLAGVVLLAVNPLEQLARGRDAGRKTTVGQLGKAVQAYYTSQNGQYPLTTGTGGWVGNLQTAGELKSPPAITAYSITGTAPCTINPVNGYCYANNGTDYIVFTRMESGSEKSKCGASNAFFVYSSQDGRAGVTCAAGVNLPNTQFGGFAYP